MKKILLLTSILLGIAFAEPTSYCPNQGNACFKQRDMMYSDQALFEGLKKTLMQSNFNIVTVSKENGVITAKGDQYNEETITEITVSLTFKSVDSHTSSVSMIASYNVMEKKLNTGQVGFLGVSLPMPVPLTGRYAMVGSGNIEDSSWYLGFYNSLDKVLFEERMKEI
ncbi:MAG: hypothetical protein PHO27_10935 [Sulfuricurvum sp.]|nr:hypothetical protein [Sulfuricurvum sp.]